MTNKLKPCPFCGSEAEIIKRGVQFKIRCKKWVWESSNINFDSLSMAIETWNTRTYEWLDITINEPPTDKPFLIKNVGGRYRSIELVTCSKVDGDVFITDSNCLQVDATHWRPLPDYD